MPEERLPILHFRTLGGEPTSRLGPDFLKTVQLMKRRQAWMREYLIEQGQDPLPLFTRQDHGRTTLGAREMKGALDLTEGGPVETGKAVIEE